jgi:hypothetical protein
MPMNPVRAFALVACLAAASAVVRAADPVPVSAADRKSLAPEIAIGPRGDVNVIWLDREPNHSNEKAAADAAAGHAGHGAAPGVAGDRHLSSMDLWFARSTDGGRTFSAPVRVNPSPGMVWGFAVSKPKIAVSPRTGTLHVVFPANAIQEGTGKTTLVMYYTRSKDGGRSFEKPHLLHEVPRIDQSEFMDGGFTSAHAFGTVGVAPDGSVHAIWVDTRFMKKGDSAGAAFTAISRDDGRTFTPAAAMAEAGVCPCCQLAMAFDAQSNLYLGSRFVPGDGTRNSTVAKIAHDHATADKRTPVGFKPWQLEGCPLKPTVVVVDGPHVYAAAFTGGEDKAGLYFSVSGDGGQTFAPAVPMHPEAAVSDAPSMTLVRGQPVVAWHAKAGDVRRVYWRTVAIGGGAMGPVREVEAPAGIAQTPALAARRDGLVQLVWQQGDRIVTAPIDPAAAAPVAKTASR